MCLKLCDWGVTRGVKDRKEEINQGWLKEGVFLKPPLESKILENPYS